MLLKALTVVSLLSGTAWSAPCADVRSCLERKEELTYELALVDLTLKTLETTTEVVDTSDSFWVSLDLGLDIADGLYASVGLTVPLGPVYLSPGVWFGSAYGELEAIPELGLYLSIGRSWMLLE